MPCKMLLGLGWWGLVGGCEGVFEEALAQGSVIVSMKSWSDICQLYVKYT